VGARQIFMRRSIRSQRDFENPPQYLPGIEMLLGQGSSHAALFGVLVGDAPEGLRRLVHVAKSPQAGAVGQEAAGPRVFNDGRLAACEVTDGALAHPGVLEPTARRLGAAEFSERALHVASIVRWRGRDRGCRPEPPTVRRERLPIDP